MKQIIFLIIILTLLPSVFSLGISPPKYQVEYEEGKNYTFEFTFINNGNTENNVQVFAEGAFKDRISFSKEEFTFSDRFEKILVDFTLPDYSELDDFGKKKIRINGQEVAPTDAGFNAVTAVEAWIEVFIPLPGQFSQITDFSVDNTKQNEDTTLFIELINRGTEEAINKEVIIEILNNKNELVETIFIPVNLTISESKEISKILETSSYVPGKYIASLSYVYDVEKEAYKMNRTFFVGAVDVDLVSYSATVVANQINRVNVTLQNLWSEELAITRTNIMIGNDMQSLPVIDLQPFEEKTIELFIDIPKTSSQTIEAVLQLELPSQQDIQTKEFNLQFIVNEQKSFSILVPIILFGVIIIGVVLWLNKKK